MTTLLIMLNNKFLTSLVRIVINSKRKWSTVINEIKYITHIKKLGKYQKQITPVEVFIKNVT